MSIRFLRRAFTIGSFHLRRQKDYDSGPDRCWSFETKEGKFLFLLWSDDIIHNENWG